MLSQKEFLEKVQKYVFPLLRQNKGSEKKVKKFCKYFVGIFWSIIFPCDIYYFYTSWSSIDVDDIKAILYMSFAIPVLIVACILNIYHRKVKNKIRPFVLQTIGAQLFNEKKLKSPSIKQLEKMHFLPNWASRDKDKIENDSFYMSSQDIPFYVQEVSYTETHGKNVHYYFRGPVIRFILQESFGFSLILLDNKALLPRDKSALSFKKKTNFLFPNTDWEPLILESNQFNQKYTSFTNDQIKARTILTPAFMEEIDTIRKVYSAPVNILFYENQLILAINTEKNMFEFSTSASPNLKSFESFYNEINALYTFIDFFKSNDKI